MTKKILEESTVNRWKKLARINEREDDEFDDDPEKWEKSWGVRRQIIKTAVDSFIEKEKSFFMDPKKTFKFDEPMVRKLHQMLLDSAQNITAPKEREIVEQMYETKSYIKLNSLRKQLEDELNKKVKSIGNQFMNSFFFLRRELKSQYQDYMRRLMTPQQSKILSRDIFLVFSDVFEEANNKGQQVLQKLKDMDITKMPEDVRVSKIPAELFNKYIAFN